MHLERILDLGCGQGGQYIRLDPENRIRIGVDKDPKALEVLKQNYNVRTHLTDISDPKLKLPYPDNFFRQMQCYLPEGDLLYELAYDRNNLWKELFRVITPKGQFEIVTETGTDGYSPPPVNHLECPILNPDIKILTSATKNGFLASTSAYSTSQFRQLGTEWTQKISDLEVFGIKDLYLFWQITGYKSRK